MSEPTAPASLLRAPERTIRIVGLATRQAGVLARWQLKRLGMADGTMARWVRAGRLVRIHPSVYALGHSGIGVRGRLIAALLYAGRGSALSDPTAARIWQLHLGAWAPIHVIAPGDRRSLPGVVVHHPQTIRRVLRAGLPVTPLPETLLGFAACATEREVRKALAEADYRHGLDPESVRPLLGRGRRGSRVLRKALDRHLPELARTNSDKEDELLLLCEREGLPIPEPNARIGRYRVDALWSDVRLVVEVDSRAAHASEARRLVDHDRDMYLRGLGYTIRRYSWQQLERHPRAVAAEIRGLLAVLTAN